MSKRTRQCIGILSAIVAYYIIHEGAHLVMALLFHAFKKINFMWLGIQVDVYRDRLTDLQLGAFCIAGATATLIMGYLMPQAYVWSIFGLLLIFNIWLLIKKVTPTYTKAFQSEEVIYFSEFFCCKTDGSIIE